MIDLGQRDIRKELYIVRTLVREYDYAIQKGAKTFCIEQDLIYEPSSSGTFDCSYCDMNSFCIRREWVK